MSFYREKNEYPANKFRRKRSTEDLDHETAIEDPNIENARLYERFLEDWEKVRERHKGQKEILSAVFEHGKRYVFARMGRKGAKTTTNIDIAWRFSLSKPRRTTYICLPTITQAIEIYWDEKRLQWCDKDTPYMAEKYIKSIDNNKHTITFNNLSTIKLIGTWSEARGRGTQPDLFIGDEVQDASSEYLDAMEPNMAAKPDSIWVLSGTPPKKKNHYHTWEDRIRKNPDGFNVQYSSYINTALPHLKSWLDNKRDELIAAGKEDVWLREYMAEDCFRSDDRVLPDLQFKDFDQLVFELRSVDATVFQPILGLVVTEGHITATFNMLLHSKYTGSKIYTLECQHLTKIWNQSYATIMAGLSKRMEEFSSVFKKPWRKVVFDDSSSFCDVVPGFSEARKDLKWSKRGLPLLREMILAEKLVLSNRAGNLGMEAQNMLKEDKITDFPHVCAMAMIANEYYHPPGMNLHEQEWWDKMQPLRDAGIVTIPPRQKGLRPYRGK